MGNKSGATRLGFAVLLEFFKIEARFPRGTDELPPSAIAYVAEQVKVDPAEIAAYTWAGRSFEWRAGVSASDAEPRASGPVIVDLDATIVEAHSPKEGASPMCKRTFGFHPVLAFVDHGADGTGEPLAALLREGRVNANNAGPGWTGDLPAQVQRASDCLGEQGHSERRPAWVGRSAGECTPTLSSGASTARCIA